MIGEDGHQAHSPGMQQTLVAEIGQAGMAMHNLDLLADEDLAEGGEGGEDGGEGGAAVDDPVREVVDFEAVGEVADPLAGGV